MDKAMLHEYRALAAEAEDLGRGIERLRGKATSWAAPDGQRRSNYATDRTADIVAQIVDLCAMLDCKRANLLAMRAKIEAAIDGLDSTERRLLRLRYVEGLSWEQVCDEINYSWKQAHRIHQSALQKMAHNDTPPHDIMAP